MVTHICNSGSAKQGATVNFWVRENKAESVHGELEQMVAVEQ